MKTREQADELHSQLKEQADKEGYTTLNAFVLDVLKKAVKRRVPHRKKDKS